MGSSTRGLQSGVDALRVQLKRINLDSVQLPFLDEVRIFAALMQAEANAGASKRLTEYAEAEEDELSRLSKARQRRGRHKQVTWGEEPPSYRESKKNRLGGQPPRTSKRRETRLEDGVTLAQSK